MGTDVQTLQNCLQMNEVMCERDFFFFFWSFVFCLFRATLEAYGGSQDRDLIVAVAASLHHSHSYARFLTHGAKPGIEPESLWILVGFINH